ncbi:MAG: DNA replication/repair protein RecF [Spirochaetota bacterium]
MAFSSIRVYHFRNLADTSISTDAREVFLVGENGQGKTNFLEAVYFVCYGSSFRTRRDEIMRRNCEQEMAVEGRFTSDGDSRTVVVKQIGRTKQIELDGAPVADRKEIVSNIPCIVFCHDDIAFVTGGPDMQRWFMNQTQSLIEPSYIAELRRYSRVLKARNAALKNARADLLEVLDHQLVEAGLPLQLRRADLARRFNEALADIFARVFGDDLKLELSYRPSWNDPEGFSEADVISADPDQPPQALPADSPAYERSIRDQLARGRDRDLDLRTSTRGPHRDRFPFRLDGRLLTDVASTGQLRLVSLILRVAQAQLLSRVTGRLPVLLLDDVLLELDPTRRARFVDALPEYEQAFFTFLPDEQYARFRRESTRMYGVRGGVIEPV